MVELVKNKIIYTLKTEIFHLIAALTAALMVHILFGDIRYSILALAVAFFVDVDHLLDYLLAEGFRVDFKSFFSGEFFSKWGKLVIFFHGWEYVLIFLVLFLFTKTPVFAVLSIALFSHYTVDFFTNPCVDKFGYFLTFRLRNKFRFNKVLSNKNHSL